MKFEAKKNFFYVGIVFNAGIICGLLTGFLPWYKGQLESSLILLQLFVTLPMIILPVYFYLDHYYILENDYLYCKLGLIRKKIALKDIQIIYPNTELSIVKTNTNNPLNTTISPSIADYGIVIKYGKFDYTFISPANQEEFLRELKKQSPDIELSKWLIDS